MARLGFTLIWVDAEPSPCPNHSNLLVGTRDLDILYIENGRTRMMASASTSPGFGVRETVPSQRVTRMIMAMSRTKKTAVVMPAHLSCLFVRAGIPLDAEVFLPNGVHSELFETNPARIRY